MSQTDSFVEEVSEELRRDKLFATFKRYGWIGALVILGLVGWAGWSEYRAAQDRSAAEAAGDEILAALVFEGAGERSEALGAIALDGEPGAIVAFVRAGEQQLAGDIEGAAATLATVAGDASLPALYREMAVLKRAMLAVDTPDERIAALTPLALPGAPYRLLAAEQIAYARLEAGDTEAAIADLRAILVDADLTDGLRQRAENLIVALGYDLDPATGETTGGSE